MKTLWALSGYDLPALLREPIGTKFRPQVNMGS